MEARGQINMYAGPCPHRILTINLNCGVTPFTITCPDCNERDRGKLVPQGRVAGHVNMLEVGILYSCFYNLKPQNPDNIQVVIRYGWYRPTKKEFDSLESSMKTHVLNGGLIHKPLSEISETMLDSIDEKCSFRDFQAFCLEKYGRNLLNETRV